MGEERLDILAKKPVPKAIMTLALPTMIGMVVQIIYNLADTFFVGQLDDADQVAAVSIAMPVFMIFMAISGIFGNGGASYISRLLGKNDKETAKKTNATAFYLIIIVGLISTVVGLIFLPNIVNLIGASPDTFDYAYSYLVYIVGFSIIIMLNFALGQLIRAEGAAKEAMIGMMIGTILNIILDPIFILAFGLGVTGAAIATIIGQAAGLVYYIYYYAKKKSILSISIKDFSLNIEIYKQVIKIGLPTSLNQILMSFATAFANIIAVTYGDEVVAATGIDMRIMMIALMLVMGLATGAQPLIGYSYGAKDYNRLKETIKISAYIGTGITVFFTVIFALFPSQLVTAFINDAAVIDVGITILYALIIGLPFLGVQLVFMNAMQAMGKGIPSLIISISRQGLLYIPAIIILNYLFGFSGFIYAQAFADVLTTVIAVILFVNIMRKFKKECEPEQQEKNDFLNKLVLEGE